MVFEMDSKDYDSMKQGEKTNVNYDVETENDMYPIQISGKSVPKNRTTL